MNENEVKALIERFAKKQQDGHFACPRCGKMSMDTESVTRNALSRRTAIYICDACGTQETIEDNFREWADSTKHFDRLLAAFPDRAWLE